MSEVPLHLRFLDEQLGSAVGAIVYVRGSENCRQFPCKFVELTFAIASRQL